MQNRRANAIKVDSRELERERRASLVAFQIDGALLESTADEPVGCFGHCRSLTSFLESGLTVGTKVKPDSRKDMFKQAAGTLQWLYQERLPQSVNAENYDDLRNFDFPQFGG